MRDLLVRWLALDQPDEGIDQPLYAAFRRLLGKETLNFRSVDHYARRLNCSTRTLARACEQARAPSPKKLIDEVVLVEAQRLLALPKNNVSTTAEALGFDELTNFTKFFKRVGGVTPSVWQASRSAEGGRPHRCSPTESSS